VTVTAVVGLQYGDEGKGKIVDALSEGADVCVRVNGGANAGHSVVFPDGRRTAVHQLPAGSFRPGIVAALGRGMVIRLPSLVDEIHRVKEANPDLIVWVDERAHVVLPYHAALDSMMEDSRDAPVGTTRSGNGPAYSHKALRVGITVGDLLWSPTELSRKIREAYGVARADLGRAIEPEPEVLTEDLLWEGERLAEVSSILDVGASLRQMHMHSEGDILFSLAHGSMLDIDHGTYPFVTSSTCTVAAVGSTGFDVRQVDRVVGVVKAYSTRIGTGPFPAEITDDRAVTIRETGREYGTTTGRPRRIGWLDLPALRHTSAINGVDEVALTLVDVLGCIPEWSVCSGYTGGPYLRPSHPAGAYSRVAPILERLPVPDMSVGEIQAVRDVAHLPGIVHTLVAYVQDATGADVSMISNGPERDRLLIDEGE